MENGKGEIDFKNEGEVTEVGGVESEKTEVENEKVVAGSDSVGEKGGQKVIGRRWMVFWVIVGILTGVVGGFVIGRRLGDIEASKNAERASFYEDCYEKVMDLVERSDKVDSIRLRLACRNSSSFPEKPIIYLYPEEETEVEVRLGAPEKVTVSYPKYEGGWKVTAYPDGSLIEKETGKKLYSLYWEGVDAEEERDEKEGFVIKGEDSAEFLDEKLEILGLNYREREEFIVYWLPRLEKNRYNYIYFKTEEEIEKEMPLEFSVEPETEIRVRMVFRGLDEEREVREQILTSAPERNGFTVVEWGGIELND